MTDGQQLELKNLNPTLGQLSSHQKQKVILTQIHKFLSYYKQQGSSLSQILSQLDPPHPDREDSKITQQWDCKWQITTALGNIYKVGSRPLARWGCSGAIVADKYYIFGGRSVDRKSKNSLHTLDIPQHTFSFIKTLNSPKSRDGHSLVAYEEKLILFGGCEGGEQETEPFNDIWMLNLHSKTWNSVQTAGDLPDGREGHAAVVVGTEMVIYGGQGNNQIYSDIRSLNLKTFIWTKLHQVNDLPGQRESMGYTLHHQKLYVFAGNVNIANQIDIYTNDLYEIIISQQTAYCYLLTDDGPKPSERHSVSISPLRNQLLVFGGQAMAERVLNDLWVYDLQFFHWREIVTQNSIARRMTHVAFTFNNSLIVYGGMDEFKRANNELAFLTFGEPTIDLANSTGFKQKNKSEVLMHVSTRNQSQHVPLARLAEIECRYCSHFQSACNFVEAFPQLQFPALNFYTKVQVPVSIIKKTKAMYKDRLASVLRIMSLLNGENVEINYIGKIPFKNKKVVKLNFQKVDFDFEFMEKNQKDTKFNLRKKMLSQIATKEIQNRIILEFKSEETELTASQISLITAGYSKLGLLGGLFKLSDVFVISSRSGQYLTVAVCELGDSFASCNMLVYQGDKIVYPRQQVRSPNLSEILNKSHLSFKDLFQHRKGTKIFVYAENVEKQEEDLIFDGIPLSTFLSYSKFQKKNQQQFFVNLQKVRMANLALSPYMRLQSCNPDSTVSITEEVILFSVLIYFKNRLVYWEYETDPQLTYVVRIKDKMAISRETGLLKWNQYSMALQFLGIQNCLQVKIFRREEEIRQNTEGKQRNITKVLPVGEPERSRFPSI